MQAKGDNIIPFKKVKVFKNASLVDLNSGKIKRCDIVVENKKIAEISDGKKDFDGELIDLEGDYVLPFFVNAYCDSEQAMNSYGLEIDERKVEQFGFDADSFNKNQFISGFWTMKSTLSGSGMIAEKGVAKANGINWNFLKNLSEYSEAELDQISLEAHEKKTLLFIRLGQDLDELGKIDKMYHKPVSQVLEDFGILDLKPTIIGLNCLEKDELQLLKNYDCKFVTTPFDDAKSGRRPLNMVMAKNLDIEFGIGSGASAEIDFFGFMRQILLNTWGMFEDVSVLSEQDVLKMATKGGTDAFHLKAQRVEVGEDANFMVIRNTPTLYDGIFKTLVWEKTKKDVSMTVLEDKILCRDGFFDGDFKFNIDDQKMLINKITRRRKNDD